MKIGEKASFTIKITNDKPVLFLNISNQPTFFDLLFTVKKNVELHIMKLNIFGGTHNYVNDKIQAGNNI